MVIFVSGVLHVFFHLMLIPIELDAMICIFLIGNLEIREVKWLLK